MRNAIVLEDPPARVTTAGVGPANVYATLATPTGVWFLRRALLPRTCECGQRVGELAWFMGERVVCTSVCAQVAR